MQSYSQKAGKALHILSKKWNISHKKWTENGWEELLWKIHRLEVVFQNWQTLKHNNAFALHGKPPDWKGQGLRGIYAQGLSEGAG